MKKVVISCRISSDDQSHYSIPYQEEVLRKYCERMGYIVVEVITDDATAKTFNRPGYQSFKHKIKTKRNYCDLFLILRWDRFSRNAFNAMFEIKEMKKYGVDIYCHDQPVDLSSPDGKMMLAIYLVSPEIENDKISIRTTEGIHKAKSMGFLAGRAPLGYINARDEANRPIVLIDELKAKFIVRAFESFAYQGLSKAEIASDLKSAKLIGKGRDQVTRILRNLVYAGKIIVPAYKGEPERIVPGLHEPIISETLFNEVQKILDGKKRQQIHRSSEEFPLRGILRCSQCNSLLTASFSKGKMGVKYGYYHCKGTCSYRLRSDEIDSTMQSLMYELQLSAAFSESYQLVLKDVFKTENANVPKEIAQLESELDNYNEMLERADDNFLLNKITFEDYNRMKQNILIKHSQNQNRVGELREFMLSFNDKLIFSINALKNLGEEYSLSDAATKKNIVSSTFPEKLVFEKNQFRTPRLNSLMFGNASKYAEKETAMHGTAVKKLSVTSFGVEYGARTHDLLNHNQAL